MCAPFWAHTQITSKLPTQLHCMELLNKEFSDEEALATHFTHLNLKNQGGRQGYFGGRYKHRCPKATMEEGMKGLAVQEVAQITKQHAR